jgi:hypothetical protein
MMTPIFISCKPKQGAHSDSKVGTLGDQVRMRENAGQWQITETMDVQHPQVKDVPIGCAHDERNWLWIGRQHLTVVRNCIKETSRCWSIAN